MRTLKILPWLARKSGIADARARELWVDAIRFATANSALVGTSEFWRAAVGRLLELLEAEKRQTRTMVLA